MAGAVVAYLLSAVFMEPGAITGSISPLLQIPTLALAAIVMAGAFVALSLVLLPPIDKVATRSAADFTTRIEAVRAARMKARVSLARTSSWRHHLAAVSGGLISGALLARSLIWLLK
jgi:hypothetical protein